MLMQSWLVVPPYIRRAAWFTQGTRARHWGKALALWGVAGGVLLVNFAEGVPITWPAFAKLPLIGGYWGRQVEARERSD